MMHADVMFALVTRPCQTEGNSRPIPTDHNHQLLSSQPLIPPQLDPTTTTPDMCTLFQMILALTTELQQARQDLVDLQKQLKERPRTQSSAPTIGDAAFPALSAVETLPAPSLPTPQPNLSYAQEASTNREKRKAIAARFFQAPSANQGFQHVSCLPPKHESPLVSFALFPKKRGSVAYAHVPAIRSSCVPRKISIKRTMRITV